MTPRLLLEAEAESEFLEASDWYAERSPALGEAFRTSVTATLTIIEETPQRLFRLLSWTCARRASPDSLTSSTTSYCQWSFLSSPSFMGIGSHDDGRPGADASPARFEAVELSPVRSHCVCSPAIVIRCPGHSSLRPPALRSQLKGS